MGGIDLTEFDRGRQAGELSTRQLNAVEALVSGATDSEAAAVANVSRQTVNAWKRHNPYFQAEVNYHRAELWGTSRDRLRSMLPAALGRLERELADENGDWRAALKLLELVGLKGDYGSVGLTEAKAIVDQLARCRRPSPLDGLIDDLNGGGPVTEEERQQVLGELQKLGGLTN